MTERNSANMDSMDMDGNTFDSELFLQKILKVYTSQLRIPQSYRECYLQYFLTFT